MSRDKKNCRGGLHPPAITPQADHEEPSHEIVEEFMEPQAKKGKKTNLDQTVRKVLQSQPEAQCSNCRMPIEKNARFCGHCGTVQTGAQRLCASCGAYLQTNEKFCGECGTSN